MAKLSARIRQGTTSALEIRLFDEAVQDATVYVTIDQGDVQITKSNYHDNPEVILEPVYEEIEIEPEPIPEVEEPVDEGDEPYTGLPPLPESEPEPVGEQIATDITVIFSQRETLRLRPGHGAVQVRWIDETGTADGSAIGRIELPKALFKGVIVYG